MARSARGARAHPRAPGARGPRPPATPGGRRSALTWSRTNAPRTGFAGDGYMFVTTSARRTPDSTHRFGTAPARFCHRRVWSRHGSIPRLVSDRSARMAGDPGARQRRRIRTTEGPSMFYQLMGRVGAARGGRFWAARGGQGTVEYVGLILLVGILRAGVVTASHGFQDNNSI